MILLGIGLFFAAICIFAASLATAAARCDNMARAAWDERRAQAGLRPRTGEVSNVVYLHARYGEQPVLLDSPILGLTTDRDGDW